MKLENDLTVEWMMTVGSTIKNTFITIKEDEYYTISCLDNVFSGAFSVVVECKKLFYVENDYRNW